MEKLKIWLFLLAIIPSLSCADGKYPQGSNDITINSVAGIRKDLLSNIAPIIKKSIAAGYYPGAVVLAVHRGKVFYQGVFGSRRIVPDVAPMTADTIFDIASLTKVVATAPSIMQLVEKGKLHLDDRVARYWPAFAVNGKNQVTIRQLLTHTSGLPPDTSTSGDVLHNIERTLLLTTPGSRFLYSDVNFIVLGHLVEIISREPFYNYVQNHILEPLKMNSTYFLPPSNLRDKIAPTEIVQQQLRWGVAHDPLAFAMGGVSGNAGLFSTMSDLGKFTQCFLNLGKLPAKYENSNYLLGPLTILKMTTRQTPVEIKDVRGLGWDIDSVYSNRGILFPASSYGHTGWTGTSLWIDPVTQTYLIVLTNRAHPHPTAVNQLIEDRRAIANIIAASITDIKDYSKLNTGSGEMVRAYENKEVRFKMASGR